MKKNVFESNVVKMITTLAVVGAISGTSLVFIYNYAMPKIKANITKETKLAIENIFPEAIRIERITKEKIFQVKDIDSSFLGYAFIAEGNGYQGVIKLIVGIDSELANIKGIEVLESQETPGLGAEIANVNFKKQFKELPITHSIEYVRNRKVEELYQVEAITGATISSSAVVNMLNKRIGEIRELLK